MGLYIKGVDMPKNTSAIEIVFIPNLNKGEVAITEPFVLSANEAIQIPKEHGRLADIDIIYRAFSKCAENETDEGKMEVYAQLMGLLLHVPTVLEAEE